jgi:ribosomal protein S18 acetylase RimI-like enzyme
MPEHAFERIGFGLLRQEEADALADLARRIWHAHYPGIITPAQIDYMLAERYRPVFIRQTLARGDRWEVARDASTLVGFGHGYGLGEGDFKLDKLYVAPEYQRHGIGAALVMRLAAHARATGHARLVLRVNKHNAQAIAAYRKHGFSVATEIVEDIGGGFVMDDYVMTLDLETP